MRGTPGPFCRGQAVHQAWSRAPPGLDVASAAGEAPETLQTQLRRQKDRIKKNTFQKRQKVDTSTVDKIKGVRSFNGAEG